MAKAFTVEEVFVAPGKGLVVACLASAEDRRRLVTGAMLIFKNSEGLTVQRTILGQETPYPCFGDPEREPKNHFILVEHDDVKAISKGAVFRVLEAVSANTA